MVERHPTTVNKSSVYLQVYPRCFTLPVRKGAWRVAAHPSASSESFGSLIVFLATKNKKESCEKIKNVTVSRLKHHYPQATSTPPAWLLHPRMRMNCLPYPYEAGQAFMMRLSFKLSSNYSFFIRIMGNNC